MKMAFRLTIAAFVLAILNLPTGTVRAEGFRYTTTNGTITLTPNNCFSGAVTIPSTINGLPVTSIEGGAFSGWCGQRSLNETLTEPLSRYPLGIHRIFIWEPPLLF